MFCPKCGTEALESQRFCKTCGSNLQAVASALEGGDDFFKQMGIDVEAVKKEIQDFGKSVKASIGGFKGNVPGHFGNDRVTHHITREHKEKPYVPKPKEYLHYSWQHNLRSGLLSLFGGAGFGVFLYYLSQTLIQNGTLADLQAFSPHPIRGIEQLVSMFWLIAAIPVLKGIAQIIYAAFFGESMATLAERYKPPAPIQTGPLPQETPTFAAISEPPPSVTEHTTHIFEEAKPQMSRETQ